MNKAETQIETTERTYSDACEVISEVRYIDFSSGVFSKELTNFNARVFAVEGEIMTIIGKCSGSFGFAFSFEISIEDFLNPQELIAAFGRAGVAVKVYAGTDGKRLADAILQLTTREEN